ncbi:MAG: cysteine desulfurase [Actinobacteria bacterium]|nr:cysteine desulfurase [Actinomycetota bacterium]
MRPEAVSAMLPFLGEQFGNPSGSHAMARAARTAVEDAREVMARELGCDASEVVFTGGGTEADNLAIDGAGAGRRVCSAVEHHAVLRPVKGAGGATVAVDSDGVVDLGALASALRADDALVSVMLANNETGVVQPLRDIAAIVGEYAPSAVLHTDAVAGFSWLDVGECAADADLVSISAHKFGGPKGVGALVVRDGVQLAAMLRGGGQERERRSGTHNVAGIVAMAAAAAATGRDRDAAVSRVGALRDRLAAAIVSTTTDVVVTAAGAAHTAGTLHLLVGGVESESLLIVLDDLGVCASAGSACASGALEQSHVLAAMGVDRELANGALRLSLGWSTTDADIDAATVALPKAIEMLRGRS